MDLDYFLDYSWTLASRYRAGRFYAMTERGPGEEQAYASGFEAGRNSAMSSGSKRRDELKAQLEIDPDDLDRCLVEHSNLVFQVGEAYVEAVAEYDGIKLEIEELSAELDEKLRKKAEAEEKKLTEDALKQSIRRLSKMQELQRDLLDAKLEVGKWEALKEAFYRRSYALQKLVDMKLSQLGALTVERGVASARSSLTSAQAEANKNEISKVRRISRR